MNTILNLGLNDETVEGLKAKTGNPRFAYDCYRRFIQMFGEVVLGIDMDQFEHELRRAQDEGQGQGRHRPHRRRSAGEVIGDFKKIVKTETGDEFPQEPREQLYGARNAVFKSW